MNLAIQNLGINDPFTNENIVDKGNGKSNTTNLIHIRNQQRNGRKSVTTVQGLGKAYDLKKMVRALKKEFNCNGTIIEDIEHGSIIQLQGDKRNNVKDFLIREGICAVEHIRIHGA
ncbi:translation initiation factor SUI1, putative [Plasmodium relictum]|uniref:Translation initiation factor SUI1, putative n=2 Tax=Plasmodium (Haemamoeba) TaxID=418104 RepID=A0A1J1HG84_PLARL|nr:translation initiation factor SUI1, putative [Plasmodium gallinaceum]XP_028535373.1 translation initiation factor SUI1, putative [Plasmodium relictum]CRG97063.1 translation initiation factor SUI1, putative [Plasmodium gallinaceum]CRH02853.1 translation initiation factor SUI1, putative [Plasmodium relictum]